MAVSLVARSAAGLALAAGLLGAAPAAADGVTGLAATPRYDAGGSARLLSLLNAHRRATGLRPLVTDTRLASIARTHTLWMATTGTLTHNLPMFSKPSHQALRIAFLGENVAYHSESVADVHQALLDSPPHRANIENGTFAVVGVAVVVDAKGWFWATQAFGSAPKAVTPAPAPPRVAVARPAAPPVAHPAPKPVAHPVARPRQAVARAAARKPVVRPARPAAVVAPRVARDQPAVPAGEPVALVAVPVRSAAPVPAPVWPASVAFALLAAVGAGHRAVRRSATLGR